MQLGHGADLLLGLACTTRKHGAAQSVGAGFHHGARRREVVTEAVVNQLATAKARRKHGARHAPVVCARAFGLVNRAGAGKDARHLLAKTQRAKAAKDIAPSGARRLLLLQKGVFANHRQLRQRGARRNVGRVDMCQRGAKGRGLRFGVGNVCRQGSQERRFAGLRGAGFQRIEMV